MDGSPVGFASLANNETIDLLYVHPAVAGQGVGTMLVDALEKLAAARGAKRLTVDVSDTRAGFLREARLYGRSSATPCCAAANGSPTPRWRRALRRRHARTKGRRR